MVIPIFSEGQEKGTVTLERQGEALNITADMEDVGRVVRLYIYGELAYYLGIPEPDGSGRLRLSKRLVCNRGCGFPKKPEYAAESREENAPEREERGARVLWYGGRPHYF